MNPKILLITLCFATQVGVGCGAPARVADVSPIVDNPVVAQAVPTVDHMPPPQQLVKKLPLPHQTKPPALVVAGEVLGTFLGFVSIGFGVIALLLMCILALCSGWMALKTCGKKGNK